MAPPSQPLHVFYTDHQRDRVFFIYLRGGIPKSKPAQLGLSDDGLTNATLKVGASVIYPNGDNGPYDSVTKPFQTTNFNQFVHLLIRDEYGEHVNFLPSNGRGDMLLDFQIPNMFLRTGLWTFYVDARTGDVNDTCIFAMYVTQWLEGDLR